MKINNFRGEYPTNVSAEKEALIWRCSCTGAMKELLTRQFPGHVNWVAGLHENPFHEAFPNTKPENIVYLTADSTTVLETLDPSCVYVIGGLVDRNRYKRLCLDRAEQNSVSTARLPIDGNLKLATSKVCSRGGKRC